MSHNSKNLVKFFDKVFLFKNSYIFNIIKIINMILKLKAGQIKKVCQILDKIIDFNETTTFEVEEEYGKNLLKCFPNRFEKVENPITQEKHEINIVNIKCEKFLETVKSMTFEELREMLETKEFIEFLGFNLKGYYNIKSKEKLVEFIIKQIKK